MKFQRINENVIKCIMTREEMSVRGLNVEDILGDRAKAEEFLQYVLTKARYEVNFETNGDVLNVQLSVMKDGSVSMMISDDQNAAIKVIAEQFKEKLREFSKVLEDSSKYKEMKTKDIYSTEKVIKYFISTPDEDNRASYDFWTRLSSLDECILLSKALSSVQDVPSTLYKYCGDYYFNIHLSMDKKEIAKNVFIMSEYSDDVSGDFGDYLMVKEHGKIIIKENALSKLLMIS